MNRRLGISWSCVNKHWCWGLISLLLAVAGGASGCSGCACRGRRDPEISILISEEESAAGIEQVVACMRQSQFDSLGVTEEQFATAMRQLLDATYDAVVEMLAEMVVDIMAGDSSAKTRIDERGPAKEDSPMMRLLREGFYIERRLFKDGNYTVMKRSQMRSDE